LKVLQSVNCKWNITNGDIETIMDIFTEKIARVKQNAVRITDPSWLKRDNMLGSDVAQAQQTEAPAEVARDVQNYNNQDEGELPFELPVRCRYVTPTPAQVMANESIRTEVLLKRASRIMFDDNDNQVAAEEEEQVKAGSGDAARAEQHTYRSHRRNEPASEFDSTDDLLCEAFPTVYPRQSLQKVCRLTE